LPGRIAELGRSPFVACAPACRTHRIDQMWDHRRQRQPEQVTLLSIFTAYVALAIMLRNVARPAGSHLVNAT